MQFQYIKTDNNKEVFTLVNFMLVRRISKADDIIYIVFGDDDSVKCANYKNITEFLKENDLLSIRM